MNAIINAKTIPLIRAYLDAELSILEREPDYIYVVCTSRPIRQVIDGREYTVVECGVAKESAQYVHRSKNAFPLVENHLYELSGYRAESIFAYGDEITLRFDNSPPVESGGTYSLSNVKPVDIINAQKMVLDRVEQGRIRLASRTCSTLHAHTLHRGQRTTAPGHRAVHVPGVPSGARTPRNGKNPYDSRDVRKNRARGQNGPGNIMDERGGGQRPGKNAYEG